MGTRTSSKTLHQIADAARVCLDLYADDPSMSPAALADLADFVLVVRRNDVDRGILASLAATIAAPEIIDGASLLPF